MKLGEKVYPAADLSEQISTAGKEASGTGNMKFQMNGALTIGTLDGANVEIKNLVGEENFFLFGYDENQISKLRNNYNPYSYIFDELKEVFNLIDKGHFSGGDRETFRPILDNLIHHDPFFVLADLPDYISAHENVSEVWTDQRKWSTMSLLNIARSGFFSSDRSIEEYCEKNLENMKKFIFDVDGTLTPSRKQIDSSFEAFMIKFACSYPVYLVTGSDRKKTIEQIGLDLYNRSKRVYNCAGNDIYERDNLVYRNPWTLPDEAKRFLMDELDYSQFPLKTGNHIDQRSGCVNFSILGRNALFEEREIYKEWDNLHNERVDIADRFNLHFPDLFAFVGGETGVDISSKGSDKGQIIRDFSFDDELHFFGDRMDEIGNDYPLAVQVKKGAVIRTKLKVGRTPELDLKSFPTTHRNSYIIISSVRFGYTIHTRLFKENYD